MSLHAVMTLNMCLESYAAAVHVMDALMGASADRWGVLASSSLGSNALMPSLDRPVTAARSHDHRLSFVA